MDSLINNLKRIKNNRNRENRNTRSRERMNVNIGDIDKILTNARNLGMQINGRSRNDSQQQSLIGSRRPRNSPNGNDNVQRVVRRRINSPPPGGNIMSS